MEVTLNRSGNDMDQDAVGYQAPLAEDQVEELDLEKLTNHRQEGGDERRRSGDRRRGGNRRGGDRRGGDRRGGDRRRDGGRRQGGGGRRRDGGRRRNDRSQDSE